MSRKKSMTVKRPAVDTKTRAMVDSDQREQDEVEQEVCANRKACSPSNRINSDSSDCEFVAEYNFSRLRIGDEPVGSPKQVLPRSTQFRRNLSQVGSDTLAY